MTVRSDKGKVVGGEILAASIALTLLAPGLARGDDAFGEALVAEVSLRPLLLDYELPGHPRAVGVGHVGVLGDAALRWRYDRRIEVLAGVRGRLPFAFDLGTEAAAYPLFAVLLRPFGELATLRLGVLEHRHGFHPAVIDEARYGYGRPLEETYNRSLVEQARQDLPDLAIAAETGGQLILTTGGVRAEVFLDWQLLENEDHREKFAVGVLASYAHRWVEASFQYRLVHYGGQRFTQRVEARRLGLDAKRQPTTLALTLTPKPLDLGWLKVALPTAFVNGRVVQSPGEPESSHWGLEVGADVTLFEMLTLGYRLWLPDGNQARWVSEDGEPVYAGLRSHRARVALAQTLGPARIVGRLDLVFADGADKVQYLTVTALELDWSTPIFVDPPLP